MWKFRRIGDWYELDDEWGDTIYMTQDGTTGNLLELIANKHNKDVKNADAAYESGYAQGLRDKQ